MGQARFIADHATDWAAYRAMEFIRPPVYTTLLATVIRQVSPSISTLHLVNTALCAARLPLVFSLARRLGATVGAALVAAGLLLVTPLYVAQAGLCQSDVPVAVACTLAWSLLVRGHVWGFALAAAVSVWTKESGYFLCAPAALLLWTRTRRVRALWPAAIPALALLAWLGVHRLLTGVAVPAVNSSMAQLSSMPEAMWHNLLGGGRLPLVRLAAVALRRDPAAVEARARIATAAAVVVYPVLFPAPLRCRATWRPPCRSCARSPV